MPVGALVLPATFFSLVVQYTPVGLNFEQKSGKVIDAKVGGTFV
jgi:hypothetical protein